MFKFTFASNFFASKTTWTAIGAIVAAVGGLVMHKLDVAHFGFAVFAALQTAFIRDTFQKAVELPLPGEEVDEAPLATVPPVTPSA